MEGSLTDKVRRFLMERHAGVYDNRHWVEITINRDLSVFAAATYPEFESEEGSFEYCFQTLTIEGFMKAFEVLRVRDISLIKPGNLITLYKQGLGFIVCFQGDNSLKFQKTEEGIMATDDYDRVQLLSKVLEAPEEFMEYTRQFFKEADSRPFVIQ